MRGARLVREAYDGLARVVADCDEDRSWAPTACRGWAVRDLTFHCLTDAQRALVAVHTPTSDPPDRDAVTYWLDWAPDPVGAANGVATCGSRRACSPTGSSCATCTSIPRRPSPRHSRA